MSAKVLKSCTRCRKHKIRCDAVLRKPLPCSSCFKKHLECSLDVITKQPNRSNDVVERLADEIQHLTRSVDKLIDSKLQLLDALIDVTASVSEIQTCIEDPRDDSLSPAAIPYNKSISDSIQIDETLSFVIRSDPLIEPVIIAQEEAYQLVATYYTKFHKYLPILPEAFYSNINHIYKESQLLFWSVVLTAHLDSENHSRYSILTKHVKKLVVEKCWLNTPRSVYVLASLLILTTWPLPLEAGEKLNDNSSIKYLSLMKTFSLQLGLHRLEFINEFSHKTNVDLALESNLNNLIRERLYKFITINSNYWLINLGLLNLNFNGFQQDYIINKSNQEDLFKPDLLENDRYINSLLKLSIIQQKLNENLNNNNNLTSKMISLTMFETILQDLGKPSSPLLDNNLIRLSIEYSKLQLYLYSFDSKLYLNINDYRTYIYKALQTCYNIVELFEKEFDTTNFNQLPIHFKFSIELAILVMTRVFYSPLLRTVGDYEQLKNHFNRAHRIIFKCSNPKWHSLNARLIKVLDKFNRLFAGNLLNLLRFNNNSIYLINKYNNHLASNMNYEMIYLIYSFEKDNKHWKNTNWENFGIKNTEMIRYLDNISLVQ